MNQFESKHLIIIFLLAIFLVVGVFVVTPIISEKADSASGRLTQAEIKAKELQDKKDTLAMKLSVKKGRENTISEKEAEKQKKIEDLGLNIHEKYLESSNKNIFFLFSSLADTINLNVAELSVEDADVFVKSNEPVKEEESSETTKEDADKLEEGTEVAEGEKAIESTEPVIPKGYIVENAKQVSISMYGEYLDIMLYFQTLDRLSDNFELVSLDISPLVLADGYPIEDYQLTPNNYDFIIGNTMNNTTKLDVFYYEDKVKENLRLAKERAEQTAQEKEDKKQETNDKISSLAKKYSISEAEVIKMARYYSEKHSVPVPQILAVVDHESGFDTSATNVNDNGSKDRGLMQINEGTAKDLARILGLEYIAGMEYIPALNMEMGTLYLKFIASSRGVDLNNVKTEDLHYVFTAYNKGQNGAEKYASNNKKYSTTPYESDYSRNVIANMDKPNYVLYEDESEIQSYNYSDEFNQLKTLLEDEENKATATPASTDGDEPLRNYVEVTSVKAVFKVINEGPNTLLLENIDFDFDTKNTKESPMSFNNLSKEDTSYVGNDGKGSNENVNSLKNKKYRDEELERTKTVIRNRIANGLSISTQLDYLKLIALNNM